jgi:acetyl esterase/lipase
MGANASPPGEAARLALIVGAALLGAACSPLSAFNSLIPKDPSIRSVAGQAYGPDPRQTLDLYAPGQVAAPRPVAIFFYGGSWESGRRQDYGWAARAIAAKGFVVVAPDYRLYPQVRFPAFLEDGALAVRWAADNAGAYGGDPSRIVLVGHSAGAYNAVMLGLDRRYLRQAGVDPTSIKAVAGLAGLYDFLPLKGQETTKIFGRASDLAATQPATFADPAAPFMFLATGADDLVVSPRNTRSLAKALRKAGVRVEERLYPGIGHVEILMAIALPVGGKVSVLGEMTELLSAETR